MKFTRLLFTVMLGFAFLSLHAQAKNPISKSFEVRYYTRDEKANGETDLKGETQWMSLDKRIEFLHQYTNHASAFFNDRGLNTKLVSDREKQDLLDQWKPQPLTSIRKTIPLSGWRSYGYKEGKDTEKMKALQQWAAYPGATLKDGKLSLSNSLINRPISPIEWRFKLEINVALIDNSSFEMRLGGAAGDAVRVSLKANSSGDAVIAGVTGDGKLSESKIAKTTGSDRLINLLIEGDLSEQRMNMYVNGKLTADFIPFAQKEIAQINQFHLGSTGNVVVEDIFLINHDYAADTPRQPIRSSIVIDEDFEEKPDVAGWQLPGFNDSHWKKSTLPTVHGGIREAGESLYLRHEIELEPFERATLVVESIDPAGEIWVNGEVVAVTEGRHPRTFDLSSHLKAGKNILAVRVKPYYSNHPMLHAPDDRNIGWFLGRTELRISSLCMIETAEAFTKELNGQNATQANQVTVHFPRKDYFTGSLEVNYYPWFPEEGVKVASKLVEVQVRPRIRNEFNIDIDIPDAALWSGGNPNLYKVEVILRDSVGNAIDDIAFTTGIRTVTQKDGELLINGKPEMLNGAQIMGMRPPLETMAKHNRCAPVESIAEEMLMLTKMGGNLLRVHVHAELDTIDGINDPRYAELADQLGIYLIWSTAGFIREGEAWNVDFEGYPEYMSQVYNHPSIVLWEASNHPNRFKYHDPSDTHDFISKIYRIISERDQSRLISPTSFWQHTHYANHAGTIDRDGNPIKAVEEFHAPLMTRGSQDAYSGYGAEWTKIRNMPNAWARSVLEANDKAYFNFEHEESAAQPNWELHRGKPWYKVQSYEWDYEQGSIGKRLDISDWRASQGYQAFSAWESMKKQMLIGYDGFSWCTLEGGANMGTYQKPLVDPMGYPKLAYYVNRMVFQPTWAGSDNVDVVYGPSDVITPVIHHLGEAKTVDLEVVLTTINGKVVERKRYRNISLQEGRNVTRLEPFQFKKAKEGAYGIHYLIY